MAPTKLRIYRRAFPDARENAEVWKGCEMEDGGAGEGMGRGRGWVWKNKHPPGGGWVV
jgi:hypothetical protein